MAGTTDQKKKQSKDALFKNFFGVSNPQAELKKAYAGLAGIEIKTGHKKTGLFGWGKGKDIYSSILDVYPQLVDANGKLDKSLAETIINTREMSDESKAALQNMIDLAGQAEEAYNQLNDYFTDIFGELGGTMTDALVDAFSNGTDVAQAFTDSVSDMLEKLAKQMVYSVTLAPLMEKAQKEMMDVMQNTGLSDEQKFDKWTGILDNLVGDAINQSKSYGFTVVMLQILYMSVLLSANLGVMNLLPLPALDGGRIVFILIEAIRGKPVDKEKEGFVHFAGFVVLMLFR